MNTKQGNSPDVVCQQSTACTPAPILLNTLQFITPATAVEIKFTAKWMPGMHEFDAADVPREAAHCTASGLPAVKCYTRFREKDDGVPVTVNLSRYPVVARAWLNHQIMKVLKQHVAYCCQDADSTQYWCAVEDDDDGVVRIYQRFTLKVEHDADAGHYRLVIGYDGRADILRQSIFGISSRVCDTMLYGKIAFRGKIYPWRRLPHYAHFHHEEMFPVLHHRLAEVLGIDMPSGAGKETYAESWAHISNFFSNYCKLEEFCRVVRHDGRLTEVAAEDTGRLAEAGRPLLFGEKRKHTHPHEGMQKYGPYRRPPGTHFRYFFIYFGEHRQEAEQLHACLSGNNGRHPHPGPLTCLSMTYCPQQDIVLNDDDKTAQSLINAIQFARFDIRVRWFAFYISPGLQPESPHSGLYHLVNEELLRRKVPVQTVRVDTIRNILSAAYSNIAGALVAKLGGIPWLPAGFRRPELVVGFSTGRKHEGQPGYMSTAVCMMQDGKFREFDSMSSDRPLYIAGKAMSAYYKCMERHLAPDRIVIHMPTLPEPELKELLMRMPDVAEPGLPVVVMTIRNCRRDVQMGGGNGNEAMPAAGTYVRLNSSTYLLSVDNCRKSATPDACELFPLRIDLWCNREGYLEGDGIIGGLLGTVYAFTRIQWHSGRAGQMPASITYPDRMRKRLPQFRLKLLAGESGGDMWFV